MDYKIATEEDYEKAYKKVYEIIHNTDEQIIPQSELGKGLEFISRSIEKYEKKYYRIP